MCTLFWENVNALMAHNGVGNVNFKGFLADMNYPIAILYNFFIEMVK